MAARDVTPWRRSAARIEALEAELERVAAELTQAQQDLVRAEDDRLKTRARIKRLLPRQDLGYLFVLTYGRSGSTLLQGILNSTPGYLIRGENQQLLRHLYDFHRTALKVRAKQRRWVRKRADEYEALPSTHPFFGMDEYPQLPATRDIRRLVEDTVLRPAADTRVTGFKEIRWADDDAAEFVAWIQEVFPGARFVVNTRDLDSVAQSGWWHDDPDAKATLERYEAGVLALGAGLGDAAFHVKYDDYTADPASLAGLFEWLGEPFDVERVRAVLEVPHSYKRASQVNDSDEDDSDEDESGEDDTDD